jgi:hypothetical protein
MRSVFRSNEGKKDVGATSCILAPQPNCLWCGLPKTSHLFPRPEPCLEAMRVRATGGMSVRRSIPNQPKLFHSPWQKTPREFAYIMCSVSVAPNEKKTWTTIRPQVCRHNRIVFGVAFLKTSHLSCDLWPIACNLAFLPDPYPLQPGF